MRRDLLSHLITVIQNVPDSQWDMGFWWKDSACGSVGCAIGHAAYDPVFIEAGLRLESFGLCKDIFGPVINDEEEIKAVSKLFEISVAEAENIFLENRYFEIDFDDEEIEVPVTKEMVISRIQDLLE